MLVTSWPYTSWCLAPAQNTLVRHNNQQAAAVKQQATRPTVLNKQAAAVKKQAIRPTASSKPATAIATLERCKSITPKVMSLFEKEVEQTAFITRLKFRWKLCCLRALGYAESKALQEMEAKLTVPLTKFFLAAFQAIDEIPTNNIKALHLGTAEATPARPLVTVATNELLNVITAINGDNHTVPEATKALIQAMACLLEPIVNTCLKQEDIITLTEFFQSPIWQKLRDNRLSFHEALLNTLSTQGQEEFKAILKGMNELI
jgi:hypothetical protein